MVRDEFIGSWRVLALYTIGLAIVAFIFPLLWMAFLPAVIVYLLLTIVKIEEEIENPNKVDIANS
jgi:hypothetical protein